MNDVWTELLLSPIPHTALPFTLMTAMGEGGLDVDAWRRCWGGSLYTGPLDVEFSSKNPLWPGKMGPKGNSRALGAFQFQPGTYEEAAARTGLTDLMPQSQLANFWNHAQAVYRRNSKMNLQSTLYAGDWRDACAVLDQTWTSFTSPKLADRYAKAQVLVGMAPPAPTPVPLPVPPVEDAELAAIAALIAKLIPLSPEARTRVLTYVGARFGKLVG